MMLFNDHHIFDMDDLKEIKQEFEQIESTNKMILTTEKDGVRMAKFESELKDLPIFVIPIRHKILFGEENQFNSIITSFVTKFDSEILQKAIINTHN